METNKERCTYAKCRTQDTCAGCERNAISETTWELRTITDDIECTLDNSGVYIVVNREMDTKHSEGYIFAGVVVRVDIMADGKTDYPIMSFIGKADNVRKAVIRFLTSRQNGVRRTISAEYYSYIGSEIAKAENNEHYVQS